jgi:hypothetical protein
MVNRFINSMLFFNARVFLYRRRDKRPVCVRGKMGVRERGCVYEREIKKGRGCDSVCACVCVYACERERKRGCVYVRDSKSVYESTLHASLIQT